jgi:hypothetical protein
MNKFLMISFLSSFYTLTAMDSCAPAPDIRGDSGFPLVLITRQRSGGDRGAKNGRLSSLSMEGAKLVDSTTPTFKSIPSGQNLQELVFSFPQAPEEGLSAKEEEDLSDSTTSLSSVVEVTLQLAEAIKSEVVLTGDQGGVPFLLVLAQAANNESLLMIRANPSSSSGKIHGSSFLPGTYISHRDNHLDGTVTIVTSERLGNTVRQVFTTLGKEGDVRRRVWGERSEYIEIDQQPHLRKPIKMKLCVETAKDALS